MKLDRYSFHARLLPALTVTVPLVLAALPWLPADTLHAKGGWGGIVKYGTSGAVGVARAYLLAQLSRGSQEFRHSFERKRGVGISLLQGK